MPDAKSLKSWLGIAKGLLNQPTAPFFESLPQQYIRQFAKSRTALTLQEDPSGNLLVKYSRGDVNAPLIMVAHLDHPGFHIDTVDGKTATLTFHGGVHGACARKGTRLRFFEAGRAKETGLGEIVTASDPNGRLSKATARVTRGKAVAGGYTMWDFPGFSVKKGFVVTRCCDDLLGVAAALCVLDYLATHKPPNVEVWGLFTRAEEVGFLGALEAIRYNTVPRDACVLSLECSKAFAHAPQGGGVIVRVGDRASIFDAPLTEALRKAAEGVAKEDKNFKFQRKLMDGGSCEATAFCAYGYRASGLAVPLGNYHNQAEPRKNQRAIGPETVKVSDWECEVRLLIQLALHPELLAKPSGEPPQWLQDLSKNAQEKLHASAAGKEVPFNHLISAV